MRIDNDHTQIENRAKENRRKDALSKDLRMVLVRISADNQNLQLVANRVYI